MPKHPKFQWEKQGFGRGKANNTNISGSVLRFRALHSVLLVRPTSLPLHSTRCCRRASTRNPGALTEAGMPIAHLSCAMTCMILYINVFVFWAAVIRYQRRVPPWAPALPRRLDIACQEAAPPDYRAKRDWLCGARPLGDFAGPVLYTS